jgi:hypothetical protein
MAEPEVEAAWRAEFERSGVKELRDALSGDGFTDELKRQAALRCWVMKLKRGGSGRRKLITMSGGLY